MTTQSPNLQLPQRQASLNRGRTASLALVYFLLLSVLGLQAWSLVVGRAEPIRSGAAPHSADADAARTLAMKLEDRNLPQAATDAWDRYLAAAGLEPSAEGKIRYRMGKLKQQAEAYQDAVGEFYRSEQLLGNEAGDLSPKIAARVRECMLKLGQYADLSREMAARASMGDEETPLQGRQVVAEIGDEKITVAGFDRMVTEQIEQLIAMQVGISDEEAEAIRRQAHAQFSDPQAKAQQLQQFVASRVLAAEARQRGLHKLAAFRRQVADSTDRLLATRLMLDEVGRRATVTPQDVERYYQANKEQYAEPRRVSIAHILCDSQESARDMITSGSGAVDFDDLAKEFSLDEATKEHGGVIPQPVSEGGDYVPGVGRNADLHAAVMAAAADTVLAVPYQSDRGWHAVKVISRSERRETTLDEVRDQVEGDVRQARREEVSQQYLEELFEAKGVKFYPAAFAVGGSTEREEED